MGNNDILEFEVQGVDSVRRSQQVISNSSSVSSDLDTNSGLDSREGELASGIIPYRLKTYILSINQDLLVRKVLGSRRKSCLRIVRQS